MFRNLRINIFVYYFLTVTIFLGVLHFLLTVLEIQNIYLIAVVMLCIVALSGIFISKLAIDPLYEYVKNLQNLSKETLHELNLPISTIIANSQMLSKSFDDEKAQKRLKRIDTACEMLKQRYNELEYMIKMQSKQDIKENFSLNQLIEQRVAFLKNIYPHIEFKLELKEAEILNDKTGLSKVIDNIIDNGVKYSQNSNIIDVRLNAGVLEIQDYGLGMDEVELLQIFDNYYQANDNMQGFGIGLSMVKRFCDRNNIDLSFKSSPNNGTTVLLKFKQYEEI
ncbi:MAG: sensor histidine kinase [Epsilonproteobacteria bacterium]|nr:MAG: sensor histidine kinase [Campylobacterota bacterium]